MNRVYILSTVAALLFTWTGLRAQVGINADGSSPHSSAMLEVKSSDKGLLIPRMTTAQRTTLSGIAIAGLMVFDTDLGLYFFHDGTGWKEGSTGNLWQTDNTHVYLHDAGDYVGIGTNTPFRKMEINGDWKLVRLTTPESGPFIEFIGNAGTDWTIGTWVDNFWMSTSTDNFSTWTDQFLFTTAALLPYNASPTKSMGNNTYRWANVYSVEGNYSGLLTGTTANFISNVGIGTTSPARRLEVNAGSDWRSARITSTASGAFLEFVSGGTPDWSIGEWLGSLRILSSTDDFANSSDEYWLTQESFHPYDDNARTLGSSSKRWSNLYSNDGMFSGRVSVGTQSLLGSLHMHDNVNGTATMYLTPVSTGSEDSSRIFFAEDHDGTFGMYWLYDGTGNHMELWGYSSGVNYGPHLVVQRNTGNVAIGNTFASGYRLSVDGKIICTEMRVNLTASWPDYVFQEDYDLMPLDHLRRFIQDHRHLPNMPAAEKLEGSGMDVGETQRLMMEKIEELTLYILQQQDQINELKEEIEKNRP